MDITITVREGYLVKFVKSNKRYTVEYLTPTQSESGRREIGVFHLLGKDLTENQIVYLFSSEQL